MANYPGFNNKIALEVLAQDIALSIRQAQVYGISVRAANIATEQAPPYGVHFVGAQTDNRSIIGDGARSFFFFADYNGDGMFWDKNGSPQYEGGTDLQGNCLPQTSAGGVGNGVVECVQGFTIKGQSAIGMICRNLMSDTSKTMDVKLRDCFVNPISHADIVFRRPNPEAVISGWFQLTGQRETNLSDLDVFVRSTKGAAPDRMVVIWSTGQISVRTCNTVFSSANFATCNTL